MYSSTVADGSETVSNGSNGGSTWADFLGRVAGDVTDVFVTNRNNGSPRPGDPNFVGPVQQTPVTTPAGGSSMMGLLLLALVVFVVMKA